MTSRSQGTISGSRNGEDEEDGSSKTTSLLLVILSLIFVVIFGGALIGGIVSGDPSDAFFITIIVASAFAASVAFGVLVRYIISKRAGNKSNCEDLSKENIRGTFSQSDEENLQEEGHLNIMPKFNHYPGRTPVQSEIQEIQARSVVEEMSALSPTTYDEESLSTFRHHIVTPSRNGFDFSKITSTKNENRVNRREDPPEGVGLATIEAAWNTRGVSQDPSGPKFSSAEKSCDDVPPINDISSVSGRNSQYNQDENTVVTERTERSKRSIRKNSETPSLYQPASSEQQSLSSENKVAPQLSTKSGDKKSVVGPPVPSTPAASEAGSFASSFFKPLNGIFGKANKDPSIVGTGEKNDPTASDEKTHVGNDTISVIKSNDGKPPMIRPPLLPTNKKASSTFTSTGGRPGSMPSTPGNKSTFTIPPPRIVPRTPMGQSVAGSVYSNEAASSTFDDLAHRRALQKMKMNQASIGASPVDSNAMPVFYDEDDDKQSSVAPASDVQLSSVSYDVFAPPGALGIVVDTTEKGCIVYSLKKSSPMKGLMNRGDLIIGLDNFDVRNMDAASLTKLMAKKAEQAERKFTLIPKAEI